MLEYIDCTRFSGQSVGVVYGGRGSERAISLITGAALAGALRDAGHEVTEYDLPEDLAALVEDMPAAVLLGMHGDGEDGTVQGLLELLRIPYTGSGVLTSALAMDKARAKDVMRAAGVPLAPGISLDPADLHDEVFARKLKGPIAPWHTYVLKPNDAGSSVGVHILTHEDDPAPALAKLRELISSGLASSVIAECFMSGPEFSVGFFDETCLGTLQITPAQGFYDFHAKYEAKTTAYASLEDAQLRERVERVALSAWRALGCRGVGRVDVMGKTRACEQIVVLEINTIPGMTATSLVPKLALKHGIDFTRFADLMLCGATTDHLERQRQR